MLSRPYLFHNLPDKAQLLYHILISEKISIFMGSESTLWTYSNAVQSTFCAFACSSSNELYRLLDVLLHHLLVLDLWELVRYDAENQILVLG